MIRQICGKVLSAGITSAVIEVSGFGIQVFMCSPQTLTVGSEAMLATHLVVKQDGIDLYGPGWFHGISVKRRAFSG